MQMTREEIKALLRIGDMMEIAKLANRDSNYVGKVLRGERNSKAVLDAAVIVARRRAEEALAESRRLAEIASKAGVQ